MVDVRPAAKETTKLMLWYTFLPFIFTFQVAENLYIDLVLKGKMAAFQSASGVPTFASKKPCQQNFASGVKS